MTPKWDLCDSFAHYHTAISVSALSHSILTLILCFKTILQMQCECSLLMSCTSSRSKASFCTIDSACTVHSVHSGYLRACLIYLHSMCMLHLTLVARASIGKLHNKTTYLVMQRILEMGEMCSAAFSCIFQQVGLEVLLLCALLLEVASVALLLCSTAASVMSL